MGPRNLLVALALGGCVLAGCATTSTPPAPVAPDGTGSPVANPSVTMSTVACESLGWCVAAGTDPSGATSSTGIEVSLGGRSSWISAKAPALTGTTLASASCWSSGCLIGGSGPTGAVVVLVDPSAAVAALRASPPPGDDVSALSCVAAESCLALVTGLTSTSLYRTSNAGGTWQEVAALPATLSVGTGLSCVSAIQCVAVGTGPSGGVAAVTSTGGTAWALAAQPSGLVAYTAVSCALPTTCLATAQLNATQSVLLASRDLGANWLEQATGVDAPAAVSCAAVTVVTTVTKGLTVTTVRKPGTSCVVGGSAEDASGSIDHLQDLVSGATLTLAYVPNPVIGVACATPTRCAGVTPSSTVSFVS